jgi:hypothetical protein
MDLIPWTCGLIHCFRGRIIHLKNHDISPSLRSVVRFGALPKQIGGALARHSPAQIQKSDFGQARDALDFCFV